MPDAPRDAALGRLKRLLAGAYSAGQDGVELLTLAAMDAIDGPIRKTETALGRLQAWVRKREASLHAMPTPDHVRP
jgi:hypothetical protein